MNILNVANKGNTAQFFAAVTIMSLLFSAFPVAFFVADAQQNNDHNGDQQERGGGQQGGQQSGQQGDDNHRDNGNNQQGGDQQDGDDHRDNNKPNGDNQQGDDRHDDDQQDDDNHKKDNGQGGGPSPKVDICHVLGSAEILNVSSESLGGHLGHGDFLIKNEEDRARCKDLEPEVVSDPTCEDGIQNQNETSVDKGGVCEPGPVPAPQCVNLLGDNLLENGSFEDNEVTDANLWQKFASVVGWVVEKVSDSSATTLELHEGWKGNVAADGDQYAELDGDEPTRISQSVATTPGATYELRWAFAPRQDTPAAENNLSIQVDGTEVKTNGPLAGAGVLSQGSWLHDNYQFKAVGASTEIAFKDLGLEAAGNNPDVGTFLDDAQLCLVREPEPEITVVTNKIVCTDEADLPNGKVTKPISATTAADWVSTHKSCSLVPDWQFEWAPKSAPNPGDTLVGPAGGVWTTFTGSTQIPMSSVTGGSFWMREVLKDGYIPFTYGPEGKKNTDNVTAEMYCHTDVLNYDNYDRVDNPKADGSYYCVAWNVPEKKYSDVTMCKYDEHQNALSGWQLALLGDEVDTLAVKPDGTTQSMINVPAGEYVLKADGTYNYGNGGRTADARFSERNPSEPNYATFVGPYLPWLEASASNGGLAIQVNGDKGVLWGHTLSPSHVYYGALSQGALDDVDFNVWDDNYNDNVGDIDVTLYNGRTGITGNDGCVTFEHVPYGEYNAEELLQKDWTNLTGLGLVSVDEPSETFNVVNRDPNQEPVQCTLVLTSDATNTVNEKGGAFAQVLSFVHGGWTTALTEADWIWGDQGPNDPTQDETQTFVNKFGWSGAPIVSATLSIAADNSFSAVLNGSTTAADATEFNYSATKNYDVRSLIANGNNELSVAVKNFGLANATKDSNPAGLYYELTIVGEGESCGVPYVPPKPIDVCYNLDGIQSEVPDGYELIDEDYCGPVGDPDPVDVCTNLEGNQSEIPSGYEETSAGICELVNSPEPETPPTRRTGGSSGTRVHKVTPTPTVLGASTVNVCPFLNDYMQMGIKNDPLEVKKLQLFLNIFKSIFGGTENPVDGVFGVETDANVKAFQEHFQTEILDPWFKLGIVPHDRPTGFVYKTTLWKINSIVCPDSAQLPNFDGENLNSNVALNS